MKTPLELLNDDIQEWIDKTEDHMAKFPFYAVRAMIKKRMDDQVKFANTIIFLIMVQVEDGGMRMVNNF